MEAEMLPAKTIALLLFRSIPAASLSIPYRRAIAFCHKPRHLSQRVIKHRTKIGDRGSVHPPLDVLCRRVEAIPAARNHPILRDQRKTGYSRQLGILSAKTRTLEKATVPAETIGAAMIRYCRLVEVPLPRGAGKSLVAAGDNLILTIHVRSTQTRLVEHEKQA
jgi:hypothetical protein